MCSEPFFYSIINNDDIYGDDGGQSSHVVKGMTGQNCCGGYAHIILDTSVTVIEHKSFYGCQNLKSIIIPSSVTYIGNLAFAKAFNLHSVTLPTNITSIGIGAFRETAIITINLPTSITFIGIYSLH